MLALKRNWPYVLLVVAILGYGIIALLFVPELRQLPILFWASADAKSILIFLLTFAGLCLFLGDGDETDIIWFIPAIFIGLVSYFLFTYPFFSKILGLILAAVILITILDKLYNWYHQKTIS